MNKTFKLTTQHIKLIQRMYVGWDEGFSPNPFGSPVIDLKRPYGNSDVIGDMYEILEGKELDEEELDEKGIDIDDFKDKLYEKYQKLHTETETALQIILKTGKFEVGTYKNEGYGIDWERVD